MSADTPLFRSNKIVRIPSVELDKWFVYRYNPIRPSYSSRREGRICNQQPM